MTPPAPDAIAAAAARVDDLTRREGRQAMIWAETLLMRAEALEDYKALVGHGGWMAAVKARGWCYDEVSRCMRARKWGATAEMLAEHRLTGTLAILQDRRRAAQAEAAPEPPPADEPEFCRSAKFEEPEPEADEAEIAPEPPSGQPELELPDVPAPPRHARRPLLDEYDHGNPAHRILFCLTLHELKLPVRVALAIHVWRHGRDGFGGSTASNGQIAELLGIRHYHWEDGRRTRKRNYRSERNAVGKLLEQAEKAGYLRSTPREDASSFRVTFPHGPPTRKQLEMVLLRSFDAAHDASDAEAAESAAARQGGGEATTPGVAAAPPRGGEATTPGVAAGAALTESGTRKGTSRGGRRMTAAEIREAEIDEAVARYLDETG